MSRYILQPRRGVALLIVLALIVLVATVSVALVRAGSRATAHTRADFHISVANDLLYAAEAPIGAWLKNESGSIVLAPDVSTPRVNVLSDSWTVGDIEHTVAITAWDQTGMAPVAHLQGGSPLRLALPEEILSAIEFVEIPSDQPPGLDHFESTYLGSADTKVFPGGVRADSNLQLPAIGACVATHSAEPSKINVNTVPRPILEAALRVAGRGGLEQILAARRKGEAAHIADLPESPESDTPLHVVGESTGWSFRIDIRVGSIRRSWWAVYTQSSAKWECVQRLAITH